MWKCSSRFAFSLLCLTVALWTVCQVSSLQSMPRAWYDEVAIIENVRGGVFSAPLSYSMCMQSADPSEARTYPLYYLGDWIQDAAYNWFGPRGTRLASILSLMVLCAASFLYAQLRVRSLAFSSLFAIIVFSYPLFIGNAVASRVDCWALSIFFVSLSLLEFLPQARSGGRCLGLVVYGFLVATSVFIWFTSVFFAPIYLWGLLSISDKERKLPDIVLAGIGAILAAIAILSPLSNNIRATVQTFFSAVSGISGSSYSYMSRPQALKTFFRLLVGLPLTALLGTVLLSLTRKTLLIKLGAVLFFIVTVFVCSRMYGCRFAYYVPFALIGLVQFFRDQARSRPLHWGCLIFVTVLSVLRGTAVSSIAAKINSEEGGEDILAQMNQEIGRGVKIYCDTYQPYFIGRELDWQMYRMDERMKLQDFDFDKFGVDWFLTEASFVNRNVVEHLEKFGFEKYAEIGFNEDRGKSWRSHRIFSSCRGGSWGPYVVYRR